MRKLIALLAAVAALGSGVALAGGGGGGGDNPPPLPPLKKQPTPAAVVREHLEALNACDWNRLMAQYPSDVTFFLPDGTVVQGREAIGDLFWGFCKDRSEDGFRGLQFKGEVTKRVGSTVNTQWVATADFLAEPYKGADAYVTRKGLMAVQVTTFDPSKMKFK
jgi:SnoaL-like domain